MNFYLLFFLLIIIVGLIVSYVYFMKEKKAQLQAINQGICPKCQQQSMELIDQRSTGCSGPKLMTFECKNCQYINTFHVENNSCGTGGCC